MINSWTSNYDDNGFYVVQDVTTGEDLLFTKTEYEQDRKVAELASYAPEMLEALKEAQRIVNDYAFQYGEQGTHIAMMVSNVIAKAGGG